MVLDKQDNLLTTMDGMQRVKQVSKLHKNIAHLVKWPKIT